jgi:hypothetical protein
MTALLAVIGNHDHLAANILYGVCIVALLWMATVCLLIAFFHGADDRDYRPRPDSPGWPEDQRTPGLGDLSSVEETPIFDGVVRWEQEGRP